MTIKHEPKLLVELSHFAAVKKTDGVWLTWETQTERDTQGFRIWRAIEESTGGYTNVTLLQALSASQAACVEGQQIAATGRMGSQIQSITARGHSTAGACYAFQDSSLNEQGTYYYVLEEVDMRGQSTYFSLQ